MSLLKVHDLEVAYEGVQVLWGVSIAVAAGETVALLGPNGSGKSTLMNSVSGLVPPCGGRVLFEGSAIHGMAAHRVMRLGIAHVLERHRLFPYMTVYENLILGAGPQAPKSLVEQGLDRAYALFPRLRERRSQLANSMSGGEQQMCAIARGLMSRPRLLLVDEPFIGLSPHMREEVAGALKAVNREGVAVLLIEQNVAAALTMSQRAYVLRSGQLVLAGDCRELASGKAVEDVFFGRTVAVAAT